MSSFQRCVAAWLACFAVLLAALAPSISHAVNASRMARMQACATGEHHGAPAQSHDGAGAEHASVHEHQAMAMPQPGEPEHPGHESTRHFEHCPFCYSHAGSFGLMPLNLAVALPASGLSASYPALFYQAPGRLFAWATQQPRAPPAFS